MSLFEKIRDYLKKPGAMRQAFLVFIGVAVLAGVIIFSTQIQNLFNADDSKADTRTWAELTSVTGGKERPLGQLVKVMEGNTPYLYAVGGVDIYGFGNQARLHNSVQKVALDNNGLPLPGAVWQDVSPMHFGRAAFAVHQQDGFLYVIAGDMHIPGGLAANEYPLLYSTIERLNLNQPNSGWEVVSLLSGVNFYPEVTQTVDGKVHVIGGVYGNILKDFVKDLGVTNAGTFPLDPDFDNSIWDQVDDKVVIGGPIKVVGSGGGGTGGGGTGGGTGGGGTGGGDQSFCDSLRQTLIEDVQAGRKSAIQAATEYANAGCGTFDFSPWAPPGQTGGSLGLSGNRKVAGDQIAQTNQIIIIDPNLPTKSPAEILSNALKDGSFVTTVSEHFQMRFNPTGAPVTEIQTGELGLDTPSYVAFTSTLGFNSLIKMGHLRFTIRYTGVTYDSDTVSGTAANYRAIPLPQGRYGHKLNVQGNGNQILVMGGASYQGPLSSAASGDNAGLIEFDPPFGNNQLGHIYRNHWVVDDAEQPISYQIPAINFGQLGQYHAQAINLFGSYRYVGSVSYLWNTTNWISTNSVDTNKRLLPRYAFQNDDYTATQGRAFFGWGDNTASGGLVNGEVEENAGVTLIRHNITNRTDLYSGHDWSAQSVFGENNYNPQSGGLASLPAHSAGQKQFQPTSYADPNPPEDDGEIHLTLWRPYDAHIPRMKVDEYTEEEVHSTITSAFSADWSLFPDIPGGNVTAFGPSTILNTNVGSFNSGVIYRQDGTTLKVFGPIEVAVPGMPHEANSTFELSKDIVFADGLDTSTATITLKDFDNNPVGGANNPYKIHVSLIVDEPTPDWPQDPGNLTVKFTRDQGLAPENPIASFWAQPDDQGIVSFKLSSDTPQTNNLRAVWTTVAGYPSQTISGELGPEAINFVIQPQSTLVAVPSRVLPDGIDASTVTATLRDESGNAIEGYVVKLSSNRLADTITPASAITNNEGIATFQVTSTVHGYATITGKYGAEGQPEEDYDTIAQTARIQFAGKIISINGRSLPEIAEVEQGVDYPEMVVIGKETVWKQGPTTVQVFRPAVTGFKYIKAGGGDVNPATMRFKNDHSIHHFQVISASLPDTQLKLKRAAGFGTFWPNNSTELFVTTNGSGIADFYFQMPSGLQEFGITKIQVMSADNPNPIANDMFLQIDNRNLTSPIYLVKVMADPVTTDPTHRSVAVRAAIFQKVGNQEVMVIPQTPVSIKFSANDASSASEFTEDTVMTNASGIASTIYTRGYSSGTTYIYAEATYLQSIYLSNVTSVLNSSNFQGNISFGPLQIDSDTQIKLKNLTVQSEAPVGYWLLRTSTTLPGGYVEVIDHPFLVIPSTTTRNPIITKVAPNIANRGTQNLSVTITGNEYVNFLATPNPTVTFTPVLGGDATKITATVTAATVNTVTAQVSVAATAPVGYWNVKVVGGETVEMPGNFDFFVTTPNGYVFDTTAAPTSIPRNGTAKSKLTTLVGKIDQFDGSFDPIQTSVTFAKDSARSDTGDALVGVNPTTSNAQGLAFIDFMTDTGSTTKQSFVKATAVVNGVTLTSEVGITKIAGPCVGCSNDIDPTLSTISAVPNTVPADNTSVSKITVTLRNSNYQPLAGRTVTLESNQTGDTISPASKSVVSDANGLAIFTVKSGTEHDSVITARVESLSFGTVVHFVNSGIVVSANITLYVPLEAKSYDRMIKVIMKRVGGTEEDINEVYISSGTNEVVLPTLYLQKNSTYNIWAKGRNHLARTRSVVTTTIDLPSTRLDYTETHRGTQNKGLLVADTQPEFQMLDGRQVLMPFHDNKINTPDFSGFLSHWFQQFDPVDFNSDSKVNNADALYWFTNYGEGAATP